MCTVDYGIEVTEFLVPQLIHFVLTGYLPQYRSLKAQLEEWVHQYQSCSSVLHCEPAADALLAGTFRSSKDGDAKQMQHCSTESLCTRYLLW